MEKYINGIKIEYNPYRVYINDPENLRPKMLLDKKDLQEFISTLIEWYGWDIIGDEAVKGLVNSLNFSLEEDDLGNLTESDILSILTGEYRT